MDRCPLMGIVHLLIIIMLNAIDNIKSTYDIETLKEIVEHGCQSGVCSQHIYYGDTIKFFDTYDDEIVEYISDIIGGDELVNIFKNANCDLETYKNDMVWNFIEFVAGQVVDEYEAQELSDDLTIEGYNPSGSMNMSRYAHV